MSESRGRPYCGSSSSIEMRMSDSLSGVAGMDTGRTASLRGGVG